MPIAAVPLTMGLLGRGDENYVVPADYHRAISLECFAALEFFRILEHEIYVDVKPTYLAPKLPAALEAHEYR